MMTKPLLLPAFLTILLAAPCLAQDDDEQLQSLMRRRSISCYDVRLNCLSLIPSYVAAGKRDSAVIFLNYWEKQCGPDFFTTRTRALFAMEDGRFSEDLYSADIIGDMLYFRRAIETPEPQPGRRDGDMETALAAYNTFTSVLARDVLPHTSPGTADYLLASYYSGHTDSAFAELQSLDYRHTMLSRYYDARVEEILARRVLYFGISLGLWEPVGPDLRSMGSHPEIGAAVGEANDEWDANLWFAFHIGDAREPYSYSYHGSTLTTQDFFGGGIGAEIARKVVYRPHDEFSLSVGIALESYSPPQPDWDEKKGVNSGLLTVGTGYGFRPEAYGGTQINAQLRYHHYLFSGAELDGPMGSFLTLRIMTSFAIGDNRSEALRDLSYRAR